MWEGVVGKKMVKWAECRDPWKSMWRSVGLNSKGKG